MSVKDFGFREGANSTFSTMKRQILDDENKVAALQSLRGDELSLVCLLLQGRSKRRIAALLERSTRQVTSLRDGLVRRLGFRNVRELLDIAVRTGVGYDATPAQYLARYVLPQLEGAKIIAPVLRDRDWAGLILRLRNGEQVTAWIDRDETQDCGGFLTLERSGEDAEARTAAWLREAAAEKIEQLVDLIDELDGDPDVEADAIEDEGTSEDALQPTSLAPTPHVVRRRSRAQAS